MSNTKAKVGMQGIKVSAKVYRAEDGEWHDLGEISKKRPGLLDILRKLFHRRKS